MKGFLIGVIALALIMSPVALAIGSLAVAGGNLEFVPLISVAPDDPAGFQATTPACNQPFRTSLFFHCYTPADISAAYGVDKLHQEGVTGKGETIVIVDSYGSPTALADLQHFSATFNLPAPDLTIIHPTGTPTFNNAMHGIQANWAVEASLDLQWAHVIAPDAKLVLIAANPAETQGVQGFPSMFIGEEFAVTHYPGSVISQSFAVTEQSFHSAADVQVARFDQVYQLAVQNRVTVVSASGDTGTANGDKQGRLFPFPTAVWPSSDPLVTSAGGTWLQFGWRWNPTISAADYFSCLGAGNKLNFCRAKFLAFTTGPGRTEAVWKEDVFGIATGGARSALFATPSFQSGISASLLQGRRGLPDLSWNAAVDGGALVYTTFFGAPSWLIVGGTSASTPQIAGLVALANQLAHKAGKQSVGYLNPLLYKLPSTDFRDIVPETFGTGAGVVTLDSNTAFGTGIAGMSTTAGWDLTTGFGTPRAYEFVHDLANLVT